MTIFKMPGIGGNEPGLEFNEKTQQYDPGETQAESLIRQYGEFEAENQFSWPKKVVEREG